MIEILAGIYYSASLAKIVTEFYRKWKRAPTQEEITLLKAEAKQHTETALTKVSPNITITPQILDVLHDKISKIDQAICDAVGQPEILAAEMAAWEGHRRYRYCFFMDQTRHYNGGKLPEWAVDVWQGRCCHEGKPMYKFD